MSDLISRSELLKHSRKVTEYDEAGYSRVYRAVSVEDIKYQPTAYDVDKVVEELEEEKNKLYNARNKLSEKMYVDKSAFNRVQVLQAKELSIHEAIEIVKGGGVNERD